jgi:hypothetical protein
MEPWKMVWDKVTGTAPMVPAPEPAATPSTKPDYLERLKMAESSGEAAAKAKTSSAVGHHQFIEKTWKDLTGRYNLGYSLEDRVDPDKSRKVAELYTNENKAALQKALGAEPTDTQLYAAHFLGPTGAKKLLTTPPFKLAKDVVKPSQVEANKNIFFDKKTNKPRTVGEVYKILQLKIDE